MQQIAFDFRETSQPASAAQALARNLHMYPEEYVLCGPETTIAPEFEPGRVASVLSLLTPTKLMLRWSSPTHEGQTDKTERWYGAPYSVNKITQGRLDSWAATAAPEDEEDLAPGLALPPPNPFIPTDFTLKDPPPAPPSHPSLLVSEDGVLLWHKQDTVFSKPKTQLSFTLTSGRPGQSPEARAYSSLFAELVQDSLNEYSYAADIAGASYALSVGGSGLSLRLGGFSHKVPELLKVVLERAIVPFAAGGTGGFQPERFEKLRERQSRAYRNAEKEQPYAYCRYGTYGA